MNKQCFIALNSDTVAKPCGDLICADGGYKKVGNAKPMAIIGDFDSATVPDFENVIVYPAEKDFSDGELCLEFAIEKGYEKIVFSGVTGGRLDHQLANLSLIKKATESGVEAMGLDEKDGKRIEIYYAEKPIKLSVCKGDVISVMPFEFVTCHRASGVRYPLNDLTLNNSNLSYGLSNVATANEVEFEFTCGGTFVFRYEV